MKVKYSFVCDSANLSQSGNMNVLGIFSNINVMQFPCVFPKFVYVSHIEFNRSEIGKHKLKLTFIDDTGKEILAPLNGEIDVNSQTPWANIILQLVNVTFPKAGTYQIDLNVNNKCLCSEIITVSGDNQIKM